MVEEKARPRAKNQNLMLENRRKLSITGVNDVARFSESSILLKTDLGTLTVKGTDLRIIKLDLENTIVDLEGSIDSLDYAGKGKGKKEGSGGTNKFGIMSKNA